MMAPAAQAARANKAGISSIVHHYGALQEMVHHNKASRLLNPRQTRLFPGVEHGTVIAACRVTVPDPGPVDNSFKLFPEDALLCLARHSS
jgi:hypothetical protein